MCRLSTHSSRWSLRQGQPVPASSLSHRGPGGSASSVQGWSWLLLASLRSCCPVTPWAMFVVCRVRSLEGHLKAVLEEVSARGIFPVKTLPGSHGSSLGPAL